MTRGQAPGRHGAPGGRGSLGEDARAVEAAARRTEQRRWFRRAARAGIVARALVYLVVAGVLLGEAASGRPSAQADAAGAFSEIARAPGGVLVLVVLAVGLAAYALWRLTQAAAGRTDEHHSEIASRLGWLASGLIYCVLCADALLLAGGTHLGGGPSNHPAPLVGRVLRLPGGPEIVGLVATGVVAGGVGLVIWGVRHDYGDVLARHRLGRLGLAAARTTGVVGDAARGVTIGLVALWLYRAAATRDAHDAKGLGQAVQSLRAVPAGRGALAVLGVGIACYAVSSVLEARYRAL
jgi:hypothetical protein